MQYWIYFYPGVGGDGFVNLLEHANKVSRFDLISDEWRIHQVVNGRIKFYLPKLTVPGRNEFIFRDKNFPTYELSNNYIECVKSNLNIIVPAHYIYWEHIELTPDQDIFKSNQIKIHLYSNDYIRVARDKIIKNMLHFDLADIHDVVEDAQTQMAFNLNSNRYAMHINIEKVWESFDYLSQCLSILNLSIDKAHYDKYMSYIGKKSNTDPIIKELESQGIKVIDDPALEVLANNLPG